MSEVWSTVIVASVSIVSIVVAQLLTSRASRSQMVLQTRFEFFQRGYKDNLVVLHALNAIKHDPYDLQKNISIIQIKVEKSPQTLGLHFLNKWTRLKSELMMVVDAKEKERLVKELYSAFSPNLTFYAKHYYKQVLGMNKKELTDYLKALRPDMDESKLPKWAD